MSSSDEAEGETFQLRDYDQDTDDERPNKRRKTAAKPLWSKGMSFVSSTVSAAIEGNNEEDEDEQDVDDERPTMGSMGGFRSAFNIGEYSADASESSPAPGNEAPTPQQPIGAGRSAFGPGGKMNKNSFAARMMAKHGYVEGQGLGKDRQGISAPIQVQLLQSRAGLGQGSGPAPPRQQKQNNDKASKPSTPGASTPRVKAPPKPKYTIAAIESRGLHVPEAMKSIIIDATGAETRTISSVSASGFSTPVREQSPGTIERSKASARIKLQLSAYAEAWDAAKEAESRLDDEESQLATSIALHEEEEQRFRDLITTFERVTADDSAQQRSWGDVVARLLVIQDTYAPYIEDLDLPELAISCLEPAFRSAILDWSPLNQPGHFVDSLQSLSSLLQIPKIQASHPRKRTTPYETLLLQHWYPYVRGAVQHEWSIYDPLPLVTLLDNWKPCLPPWLVTKLCGEIILPRLIEGVHRFPKRAAEQHSTSTLTDGTSTPKRLPAPDLHAWLFDWWSLLSDPDFDLELFPELRSAAQAHADSAEPSYRELVDAWCTENDLLLQNTGRSDALGRLLYRLVDVTGKGKGSLVYIADDVLFDGDGKPWMLDDDLMHRVRGRTS
ncbi:Tuftelin-interacting protein 11 [Cyphellophora attinorum]|uniref:Tuftelin-interacting protein 11 n=1 Tax=Cyphellophora attinorum TaxID=1664694 RepID=A0A0N1P0Q0_9EURO|nr:Tuftelin-interacting protein 11 [Phialophora attinorum]KPI40765.1 Tuftelin-interacting protein 11 [Phialophora attinorum]